MMWLVIRIDQKLRAARYYMILELHMYSTEWSVAATIVLDNNAQTVARISIHIRSVRLFLCSMRKDAKRVSSSVVQKSNG